jgi:hypothetical protein
MQLLGSMASGFAVAAGLIGLGALAIDPPTGQAAWAVAVALALAGAVGGLLLGLYRRGAPLRRWNLAVWLGFVPAWGFAINATLPDCTVSCEETYEALAWPGVLIVGASYALGLLAVLVHERRPTPLRPAAEALLAATLLQAATTCAALAVQFAPQAPFGLLIAPVGLPLVAPGVATAILGGIAWRRLGALGAADGARGLALWVVASGAWVALTRARGPYLGALGDTCGWTWSTMQPPVGDCHYLCTVAAQGSPWLVRPERIGRRRGRPILVNRQLAVANAFEDLLRERWPRVGRAARRVYDALARDLSAWLCYRPLADLMWLAMLPAQTAFELALLLFDPGDPEARIDSMYR